MCSMGQQLFVITGATGTGKTTVSRYLTEQYGMPRVVTHTTRPMRPNEVAGQDYYFETPASFKKLHLIESVTYADYQYGSSREGVERAWETSDQVSIVLDTKGALTYWQTFGTKITILYLTISDASHLQARLQGRGDQQQMIKQRLASTEYRRDLKLPQALLDVAHVIVNDDWAEAKRQIDALF